MKPSRERLLTPEEAQTQRDKAEIRKVLNETKATPRSLATALIVALAAPELFNEWSAGKPNTPPKKSRHRKPHRETR